MALLRTYICQECQGQFDFLHHPSDEPPPSHCPLCGADVSGKKKRKLNRAVTAPAIRGPKTKATDGVYRQMEAAADVRREEAARMLGINPNKLNGMKMTNMKDNLREGDFSYMPAQAAKIQGAPMDLLRHDGNPLGAGFGSAQQIPIGLPGRPVQEMTAAMSAISSGHRSMVQATVASGKKK